MRLRGMRLEFEGATLANTEMLTAATVMYQAILERDPTDGQTLKRQIALSKSQGNPDSVIKLLNDYLAVCSSDFEAWLELCALYLEQGLFQHAAFCMEELILLQPQNYHLYVKYGEVLYSVGGLDNYLLARKQFSFALELSNQNNLRSWWGLIITSNAITHHRSAQPKDIKMSVELYDLAAEQLAKLLHKTKTEIYAQAALKALAPPSSARNVTLSQPNASSQPSSSASTPASSANTSANSSSRSKGSTPGRK